MNRPLIKTKNIKLYLDGPWDEDVREYGAPMRFYLHTKHWLWIIGLTPRIRGQVWTGSEGYTDRYRWIVRHPKLRYHRPERCNGSLVVTDCSFTSGSGASVTITQLTT